MRPHELNLLVVFDAIMTERSITRAANRLNMTQPAVSNAVRRMRVAWKDDLFVKSGRNIQPTLKAQNLWEQIKDPVSELSAVIRPNEFDPKTVKRTFRISLADIVAQMLLVPLRKIIEEEAPNVNIHSVPYTITNAQQVLDDANVDLVLGAALTLSPVIRAEYLFDPFYVCVMRPDHPLAKGQITFEEFANAEHLLVSLSGDSSGFTDEVLAQKGLTRRVSCTVNQFSVVPDLLVNSKLICVVPAGAVHKQIVNGTLAATLPPFEMPKTTANLFWHKRQDKDPGLVWLREKVKNILVEKAEIETISVKNHLCSGCLEHLLK
ncbi:MAG: LysR family transcriptional regulator [Glaciecola sp.]|jgi:DNA-binding transcriptional LysR family regulator